MTASTHMDRETPVHGNHTDGGERNKPTGLTGNRWVPFRHSVEAR